jgi:hypothetical protein
MAINAVEHKSVVGIYTCNKILTFCICFFHQAATTFLPALVRTYNAGLSFALLLLFFFLGRTP